MPSINLQVRDVRRYMHGEWTTEPDKLTIEEPLELRLEGESLAVIMRTPGEDRALAAGFLITEAIVPELSLVERIDLPNENIVQVRLKSGIQIETNRFKRNFYASSSCGICGKTSIDALTLSAKPITAEWKVDPKVVLGMPERLRETQKIFGETGSLHAAGIFDRKGDLIESSEDVGRHNAVDKVIGKEALAGKLPVSDCMLMVSGRISFEITQKALMAGIPLIAAVSGASSLAVGLAEDQGLTLIGFVRGDSMTVYHGAWRIAE
jgi:FdhD protein